MKICFVSGFPPSKAVLNEYGFHVARELQADPLISLTILADDYSGPNLSCLSCLNSTFSAAGKKTVSAIMQSC